MEYLNLPHAIDLYKSIKDKDPNVTKDIGQLYFAIVMLGDEMARLQSEIAKESTQRISKKK